MAAQQSSVVLPVRALDGRTTSVRLPAAASVRDLKAALRVCFPPAQAAPAFHLFLRGGKLLLDAKIASLSLARGEFVSLIPFTAKPAAGPAVFPAAKRSKFAASSSSSSTWRGVDDDVYAEIGSSRVPAVDDDDPASPCHGVEPLDPAQMVEHLKHGLGKHGQIRHVQVIPGREASFCPLPSHLSQPTRDALTAIGVTRLYSHQAQAIAAAAGAAGGKRKHVVVSTSTSSGKSLCYNVPVLESITRPGGAAAAAACALYVFPTKALAQDQLKTLLGMTKAAGVAVAGAGDGDDVVVSIYDGDTPMRDRARIRRGARVLITNPDMLHVSILPCHAQFRRILANLEHVVVDEAHAYRGAFGCHAALILRRLRRVCADVYGSHPTFISCTATLANPREHVTELAGLDDEDDGEEAVELVENDGSPCGPKHFVLWNPAASASRSAAQEVAHLFAEMVQHGLRCIAFCKTRKLCETVLARAREVLAELAGDELAGSVCAYRGGYVAEDRRRIEAGLFGGTLRGVAATNALELGIDVGGMDATLHLGFPGSAASLWQQAGRSGRRSRPSVAVYVGLDGAPLDHYFMSFPHKLFGKPVEGCHVDAGNRKVLRQHLACAAFEKPLRPEHDTRHFGAGMDDAAMASLRDQGHLKNTSTNSAGVWRYAGAERNPARAVSIRAIEHERYKVVEKKKEQGCRVLEEIEESKAFFQVHDGAVYMHQGVSYLVEKLDLSSKMAYCRAAPDLLYYTRVHDVTDITILHDEGGGNGDGTASPSSSSTTTTATTARSSECRVTTKWVRFDRIWRSNDQLWDSVELDLPAYSFGTQAVWVPVPEPVRAAVEGQGGLGFDAGVHAAAHALLSVLPLRMMCAASDLGTRCSAAPGGALLLYDKHPGGIGLAAQVERLFGELLVDAVQLVKACGCAGADGCPSCVQSFACGGQNRNLDKQAALIILRGLMY